MSSGFIFSSGAGSVEFRSTPAVYALMMLTRVVEEAGLLSAEQRRDLNDLMEAIESGDWYFLSLDRFIHMAGGRVELILLIANWLHREESREERCEFTEVFSWGSQTYTPDWEYLVRITRTIIAVLSFAGDSINESDPKWNESVLLYGHRERSSE